MLRAASHSVQAERMDQVVELVWTGPQQAAGTFRRIDQALCELIDSAQSSILIVSFAVYMVPSVATALHRAAQRGVVIDICIEAPEPGGNQVAYDTVAALGSAVRAVSAVYVWPAANRPTAANGSLAALHAKCAVADESTLLVSSANLTNHALSMNLELGLVVRGGALPNRVAEYFRGLIQAGVLISHEQLT